jgi:hypothetical protein
MSAKRRSGMGPRVLGRQPSAPDDLADMNCTLMERISTLYDQLLRQGQHFQAYPLVTCWMKVRGLLSEQVGYKRE